MYLEARKIHLIEKVLKVENEHILIELETVFNRDIDISNKPGIDDFVGIISKEEAAEMLQAIAQTCENIDSNEWTENIS